jgi:oxygen-independent coproporphyrinogen-3 oxidase
MQHRDLDAYIKAIEADEFPSAMAFQSISSESIHSDLKASFDRGVLLKHELGEWFDALMPLFTAWQKRGLVNITPFAVELTLAGQFWSVTLATNAIQVIQNQTQAMLKSA